MSGSRYRYCGLVLDSAWPLPDLPQEPPGAPADILVRRARLPASLPEAAVRLPTQEIGRDEILWRLDGVARYRVCEGGQLIEIDPAPNADPAAIILFLLHPVFTLACIRRGDWMLGACAICTGDTAVAFVGPTASGKSSLAAGLVQRGHKLLADGLLRVERRSDGTLLAHPQAPWTMLWPDLCERQPHRWQEGTRVRSGLELRRHELPSARDAVPLTKVCSPRWWGRADPEGANRRVGHGARAVEQMLLNTAGQAWVAHAGDPIGHLQWAVALATRCPVEVLPLSWGWDNWDTMLDRVEAWAVA